MAEKKVGTVTHYYSNLSVGIIELSAPLKVGDNVHFKGSSTNFVQPVAEMQYDRQDIVVGNEGQEVGVKVNEMVRAGDEVFVN